MGKFRILRNMKKFLYRIKKLFLINLGIKRLPDWYFNDLDLIIKQKEYDQTFQIISQYPIVNEKNSDAGNAQGHYFHQDLYSAQKIYENNPIKHVDIGSRIDGFVAHVASYRKIELLDIRPFNDSITNVIFREANLLDLPADLEDYCDSISSLHVIEHIGLGRYGDPIDYWGYLKALDNVKFILKEGGLFYFSVPIGPQRIEFNAHRVFSLEYLIQILNERFRILEFAYVDDKGDLHIDIELNDDNIKSNFDCYWGCGIFILQNNS